jgi:xanthosine utilization system XapX-like protein
VVEQVSERVARPRHPDPPQQGLEGLLGRLVGLEAGPVVVPCSTSCSADFNVLIALFIHLSYSLASRYATTKHRAESELKIKMRSALNKL